MGKGKDLSDFDKDQIVMARLLGQSISKTAALVGCSRSAVVSTYQKWSKEGESVNRRQGHGRPRLIDTRGERRLARVVRSNIGATVAQITENVNAGSARKVSEHTVHRSLLRMGLRSHRAVKVPILSPVHCQKRIQWAHEHENWTTEQWKKVAWPEAEIKVREATSNDPWGPSSSLMTEIADLTYNVVAFSEIMSMIWKRLNDHGKNWSVYKALTLLDYLIKTGSERVSHQCKENIFAIQTLKDFQYIDRDGKDQGINVREKSKQLVCLLKDDERLKGERAQALKRKEGMAQVATGVGSNNQISFGPGSSQPNLSMSYSEQDYGKSGDLLPQVLVATYGGPGEAENVQLKAWCNRKNPAGAPSTAPAAPLINPFQVNQPQALTLNHLRSSPLMGVSTSFNASVGGEPLPSLAPPVLGMTAVPAGPQTGLGVNMAMAATLPHHSTVMPPSTAQAMNATNPFLL
ncbi:LOW QUALITY PROTEIN: uncharacterized protein RCH25_036055 [Pelodytes ibericus]